MQFDKNSNIIKIKIIAAYENIVITKSKLKKHALIINGENLVKLRTMLLYLKIL